MRIFVAGGTGVIGRPTVRRLLEAGHTVSVMARSPAKAALIGQMGATPVEAGLFDTAQLADAMAGHDAVINLATNIPPPSQAARANAWTENERIRREGSGHVVDAALAAGVTVLVQESLAFAYANGGDAWLSETSPLLGNDLSGGIEHVERNAQRFADRGGRGVVLRFGRFYNPESDYARAQVRAAALGMSTEIGAPDGYQPLIAIDDAVSAVIAALDVPTGIYNIVDREPLTRRQIDTVLAGAVGRTRLWRPLDHLPAKFGPSRELFSGSNRVSNRQFTDVTGWRASSDGSTGGLVGLVRELGYGDRGLRALTRLFLWILGLSGLAVGVQALFAPQYFYDEFPFGRGWVALDPPYNEHLIRDVGAFNLALAAITFVAIVMRSPLAARLAALAWLVFSVPHGIYHSYHLQNLDAGDAIGILLGTAGPAVLALLVLVLPVRPRRQPNWAPAVVPTKGGFV